MHDDCFSLPPAYRCGFCQQAAARVRERMNRNRLTAAARDLTVPDDDWCQLVQHLSYLRLDQLLEETR